ncbi:MAG: ABC transporter permease subunit [Oscillibacter sp.]|jgi:NitT/TauT family transport system permease protein|nr:ABC transporter permease subunit [Oscillibacter sp.]
MGKTKSFFKKYWGTICIYAGLVLFYIFMTTTGRANAYLFPKPRAILKAFYENRGVMLVNLLSSLSMMIPSILISLAVALSLGTFLGMHPRARDALHPVIYAFSVIPSILLSPFALLLAPTFRSAAIFLIVYGSFWSTLFATITGIMTIDKRYLDNAAALELRGLKRMFRVILPAASPSILAGFVNSLRSTFVMLVYAEMYGAQHGMGFFVKKYAEFGIYANTWCGFIFMVIVLVIVMQLFEKLKRHMLKWTIG